MNTFDLDIENHLRSKLDSALRCNQLGQSPFVLQFNKLPLRPEFFVVFVSFDFFDRIEIIQSVIAQSFPGNALEDIHALGTG